ncbi:PKD domain-containing protein [bacterium]|nr:PKD domain-containing protein [bacterium]
MAIQLGCGGAGDAGPTAVPSITSHPFDIDTATLTVNVTHPRDNQTLQVSVSAVAGLSVTPSTRTVSARETSATSGSAVFTWSADDDLVGGSGTTTISVVDSAGHTATATQLITVTALNHTPVIVDHTSSQATNGDVILAVSVSDSDQDDLTVSVTDVSGFSVAPSSVNLTYDYDTALFTFTRLDNTAAVSGSTTITVTDEPGAESTAAHTIAYDPVYETTADLVCTPDPNGAEHQYAPFSGTLDASASDEHITSAIASYDWDTDADGTYDITDGGATQPSNWPQPGTYNVIVRAVGEHSNDTFTGSYPIYNPISLTATPLTGTGAVEVTFTLNTDNLSTDAVKYEWDWDADGTVDFEVNSPVAGDEVQAFTYTNSGATTVEFEPIVYVTDDDGNVFMFPDADAPGDEDPIVIAVGAADAAQIEFTGADDPNAPAVANPGATYTFGLNHPVDGAVETSVDTVWIVTPAAAGTWAANQLTVSKPFEGGFVVTATYQGVDNDPATTRYFTSPVNQLPDAVLDATPTLGADQLTVFFDATGSSDPDGTIVDYWWDFDGNGTYNEGDVGDANSEAAAQGDNSPQHVYSAYGIYHATVIVVDDRDGESDPAPVEWLHPVDGSTVNDIVLNQLPDALLYIDPNEGLAPLTVTFDARTSSDVEPPPGAITLFEFDFGEGAGWQDDDDNDGFATHVYSSPGEYAVGVRVTDNWDATDVFNRTVRVNAAPNAVLTSPDSTEGHYDDFLIHFDATDSADPDGTIELYEWDYDADGIFNEGDPGDPLTEAYAYGDNTPYTRYGREHLNVDANGDEQPFNVTLRVTDDDGLTDTATLAITVLGYDPVAEFDLDYDPDGINPDYDAEHLSEPDGLPYFVIEMDFSASHDNLDDTEPDTPQGGGIVAYSIDWGDGNVQALDPSEMGFTPIIRHSYSEGNITHDSPLIDTWTRQITLTVTDTDGLIGDTGVVDEPDNNPGTYPIEFHGWRRCLVDNGGGDDVGRWSSMHLVNDNPAIAYYDNTNHRLMYVRAKTPVPYQDSDWDDPIVVHEDDDYGDGTPVDVGQYCCLLQVGNDDRPAIAYYDAVNDSIWYIRAQDDNGDVWDAENDAMEIVDTGSVEGYISMAFIDFRPAISYVDDGDVMYFRADDSNGDFWTGSPVLVDNANGVEGHEYTSLCSVSGYPAIAYRDVDSNDLTYTRASNSTGSSWAAPIDVDTNVLVVQSIQLMMVNGRPALVFHQRIDDDNRNVEYIRASADNGADWPASSIVLGQGKFPAMAVAELAGSVPWVSFFEFIDDTEAGRLKVAKADNINGSGWDDVPLKDADPRLSNRGQYTSIIMIEVEEDVWRPAISYYDVENETLRYCIYN